MAFVNSVIVLNEMEHSPFFQSEIDVQTSSENICFSDNCEKRISPSERSSLASCQTNLPNGMQSKKKGKKVRSFNYSLLIYKTKKKNISAESLIHEYADQQFKLFIYFH